MGLTAFGHPLSALSDGIVEMRNGRATPLPLKDSHYTIDVRNGLATVKTTRTFVNEASGSIEALLTFPVPFDAILTGLTAEIDGRRLHAVAKNKQDARVTYEDAIDQGKMAILHEEPFRGIHMLSIGQLGAGKTVSIETEMVMALEDYSGTPFIRIPLTVGEIYGNSPLLPSDSLLTQPGLKMVGRLSVTSTSGRAEFVSGEQVESGMKIPMTQSIELLFPEQKFGFVSGFDAWGREVSINLKQSAPSAKKLDVAIILDRSGSTSENVGTKGKSIRSAIEDGVRHAVRNFHGKDRIAIWEFDDDARLVAEGYAAELREHGLQFTPASGGTAIGQSIDTVIRHRPSAVVVLTDGQTYASEAQMAASLGYPISAVLVGAGSLDAMIGHLAASTGGQVFAAAGDDVETALERALVGVRKGAVKLNGKREGRKPNNLSTMRSGTEIGIVWGSKEAMGECDAVGRYAMALAMPLFEEHVAGTLAELHGLVTHLTSLVLVDEVGEKSQGLPQTVKVALPVAHATGVRMMVNSRASMNMVDRSMSYSASPPASILEASASPPISAVSKRNADVLPLPESVKRTISLSLSNRNPEFDTSDRDNQKDSLSGSDRGRMRRTVDERRVSPGSPFNSLPEMLDSFENVSVDWNEVALNLNNDISDWPQELVNFIERCKKVPEIVELAMKLGLTVQLLLILHLSKRDENDHRNAARVYRNIISTVDRRFERLIAFQQSELSLS